MKLIRVAIRNFRALDDVELEFGNTANIICGPNATGKSSILEAIRLAKSLVAPRIFNEGQQVLIQLQALSPHFPQSLNVSAIAGDIGQPTLVETIYRLDDEELAILPTLRHQLVTNLVQAQLANQTGGAADLVQFFRHRRVSKPDAKPSKKWIRILHSCLSKENVRFGSKSIVREVSLAAVTL
jgi:hypothetical protein